MQAKVVINAVAAYEGVPPARVREILRTSLEYIIKSLEEGQEVVFSEIGKFYVEPGPRPSSKPFACFKLSPNASEKLR
jgi:nucleoid DNA-binding protein